MFFWLFHNTVHTTACVFLSHVYCLLHFYSKHTGRVGVFCMKITHCTIYAWSRITSVACSILRRLFFTHCVFFLSVDSWHISWFLALRHLPLLEIFLTKTLLSKLTDKIATVQQPADMIWTLLVCFWQRLSAFWVCSCKPSSPVNDICALDNMLKRTAL